ncbi:LysR family transcriptional regulator [Mesosutterella sp. AGMB02718]|uniref:LysR family transcriptional regulator n=1 Tax=Mesosutterella faecium TaxID=2925194 RepID=A0ABT7IN80_9BURK|nr:LysR family transcriptional regulator [Mesosutterella sp. AGMB02718]MDL2059831.1 LysR family transcriptional regulator [Mesosutterella sp. AGMB02718]
MNEKPYQYVQALLSAGSFSKAAKRLNISQPSLSQFIMRLEKDAGAVLIDRLARPLKLTPAGMCWCEAEKNVSKIRELCRIQIRDMGEGIVGKLSVGTPYYFESYFLSNVLPSFLESYPEVEISIEEKDDQKLEELVAASRIDLAIVPAPREDPGIASELLFCEPCLIAVRKDDPVCAGANPDGSIDFAKFDRRPFVVVKPTVRLRGVYNSLCARTKTQPRIAVECGDLTTALSHTISGLGPSLVTEMMARQFREKAPLEFFTIRPAVDPIRICAIYSDTRYLSKAGHSFIGAMKRAADRMNAQEAGA